MKTLEDFLEAQCGMVTPNMVTFLEDHREFVETAIHDQIDPEVIWKFLPELKDEHYHP